ncbi:MULTISPECIES: phosphodiesterase [Mycobacterium]|uniref:Phosphodiesterase n=1 Tax=Mycobacterium syngnathidarum TaxID=1908205 RepID=A0A1Q9WID3_9MYCO|nr:MULTISPECIES: phosphodiesterase [Mycobacterium]MCG7607414.1 phosphodiesterase [Mycobacterium sp. CnD-18-1]OHU07092.1 phosphodiesterase [Mycobacterium syngnathidarum]OLT98530.1 phosphodiesterase [Mycobacterium syngnathidarum]
MRFSDIASLPVELGAAVRHRRLFHPSGVLARGSLERTAPAGWGLPLYSCDIVGRLSKGIGTPDSVPDIAGLAWRMPPQLSGTPWDVLLASTLAGNRFVLWPANSWTGITFSSVMPLRFEGQLWWLRARLTTEFDGAGLSLDSVNRQLERGGLQFDIEQSPATGEFEPLARLSLRQRLPHGRDVSFDPALHEADGVQLAPHWLADVRRAAYHSSRVGRDAE